MSPSPLTSSHATLSPRHDRVQLGGRRGGDRVAGQLAGVGAAGADLVLVEDLAGHAQHHRVELGVDDHLLDRGPGVEEARRRAEPGGQRGVHGPVEGLGQRRVVAGLAVDLGQVDPDRPERVVPDRGVEVHAAVVLAAVAEQLEPEARVEDAQVVVEVVAGEHVAQRQAAVGVADAEEVWLGVAGAATLEDRDAVGALDPVADHVAEVVGEALVERAGLAGVLQPGRGGGDAVGDLVAGGVDLDLGDLGLAVLGGARVAVDHLGLAQRVGEQGVAVVGGAVVHRGDQRAALAVPRVAAQRRVVVETSRLSACAAIASASRIVVSGLTTSLPGSCPLLRTLVASYVSMPPVSVCWSHDGVVVSSSSTPSSVWMPWPVSVPPIGFVPVTSTDRGSGSRRGDSPRTFRREPAEPCRERLDYPSGQVHPVQVAGGRGGPGQRDPALGGDLAGR